MLTEYIQAAMDGAETEYLDADGVYYGSIPALPGVWATGATREACLAELREVLEDWLLVSLVRHVPIPPLNGIELAVREVA